VFFVDYSPPADLGATAEPHRVEVGSMPMVDFTGMWETQPLLRAVSDTLKLARSDRTLSLRLYVDNTFTEAYFQGGRVVITMATPAVPEASVTVVATQPATLLSAKAWRVGSIWVSPEEVLRTPRIERVKP